MTSTTASLSAHGWGVCLSVIAWLLIVGCAGSRPPYDSGQTYDFVSADTVQVAGAPLADVYPRLRLRSDWPQHTLLLQPVTPDQAGQVRSFKRFRLMWPIRERGDVQAEVYAFTVCTLGSESMCEPERVTLFFAIETPGGRFDARRFDMRPARRLILTLDGDTEVDVSQPSYESHWLRSGFLEELWLTVSARTFQQMLGAERIHFRFGRDDIRLVGREVKPLRALWAATRGEADLTVE